MRLRKPIAKIVFSAFILTLFLYSGCLLPAAHSAEEPVVEINNWSDFQDAANDPTIQKMKLNRNISSKNTCSVHWKVTSISRVLDLNGHSITSTGGPSGDCAMNVSYETGWNNYSLAIKNGKLAQNLTSISSSSLIHVDKLSSTASNYNLILQDVDMEMSPNTRVGSAVRFEMATNTAHSRRLEINGGKYTIVGSGAIHFQTYTSSNGNTEYSPNDRIVLKKMQIENNSTTGFSSIFSSNHINKSLSSIIHSGSELYDGETLVTDLSPVNYSSRNVLTIRPKRAELSGLAVSLADWTYGEDLNTPEVTGNIESGLETFSYRAKGTEDWGSDIPTTAGDYELKLNVAQTENYLAGEATTEFSIRRAEPTPADDGDSASGSIGDQGSKSPDTGNFTIGLDQSSLMQPFVCFCAAGIVMALILIAKRSREK